MLITCYNKRLLKVCLMGIVITIGIILRLIYLDEFPRGIHGDEAWTGIRAHDVIQNGWFGFFDSVHSIGQWGMPVYVTTPFVLWINDPIISIRLPMALLGCAAFLMFARFTYITLGFKAALFVAGLLATFPAHIIVSRVAMPPVLSLFFQSLTLWLFSLGMKTNKSWYFILVGSAIGLGSISYAAFPAFGAAFLVAIVVFVVGIKNTSLRNRVKHVGLIIFGGLPFAAIFLYELITSGALTTRFESALMFSGGELSFNAVWAMVIRVMSASFIMANPDGSDGLGDVLFLDWFLFASFILACLQFLRTRNIWFVFIATIFICNLFLGASISKMDFGLYRRVLPIFPLFFWLAASGLRGEGSSKISRRLCVSLLSASLVMNSIKIYQTYQSEGIDWVYCRDLTHAALWIRDLEPAPQRIVLYSSRWSVDYEVWKYLLRDLGGVELINGSKSDDRLTDKLVSPRTAFILLGEYRQISDEIIVNSKNDYGGNIILKETSLFSVYMLIEINKQAVVFYKHVCKLVVRKVSWLNLLGWELNGSKT